MAMNEFIDRYRDLEGRIRHFAELEDGIYLPNIEPRGLANYIFICMEPSLGEWAKNKEDARRKVNEGFRNFVDGYNIMILHYCIRRFLCNENQRYHMTDFSKEAMLVKDAKPLQAEKYAKWYPLLEEEINLVADANARIFAVGKNVARALKNHGFYKEVIPIIHYSSIAAMHHHKFCKANEQKFEDFKHIVNPIDFLAVAKDVINDSGIPEKLCKTGFDSLRSSGIELMFNYYCSFKSVHSL